MTTSDIVEMNNTFDVFVRESPQVYYTRQSRLSDPGVESSLLVGLPTSIGELCAVVQGVLIHYCEGALYHTTIPRERTTELNLRTVEAILTRIRELDAHPLTVARLPERRVVGCCRDFALLLTAILRSQGVPARARYGFATYFGDPNLAYCDHVVCEYWHADAQRWMLVDPQQDALHCTLNRLDFDPHDLPHDRFLSSGHAWLRCRTGEADSQDFGYSPDARGWNVVRSYLVHDLAALNRMELLIQDGWGLATARDAGITEDDMRLLDCAAALIQRGEDDDTDVFLATRALYETNRRLRVPPVVTCVDIVRGSRRRVALT